jgi:hypothetical protein
METVMEDHVARATLSAGSFRWLAILAWVVLFVLAGCHCPDCRDTHINSPYPKTRVVAVAPFVNMSGSPDVEPLALTDLFFSELQMVEGFQVLPLNRTLAAMAALKMPSLTRSEDAVRLAEAVGADLIFVGAITAYDPYDPPEVGLTVQLYAVPGCGLDEEPALAGVSRGASLPPVPILPRAQICEVYNARHDIVRKQVREFAEIRGSEDSPLGWRLYMKSIQHYLRFACYRAISRIVEIELNRIWLASPVAEAPRDEAIAK